MWPPICYLARPAAEHNRVSANPSTVLISWTGSYFTVIFFKFLGRLFEIQYYLSIKLCHNFRKFIKVIYLSIADLLKCKEVGAKAEATHEGRISVFKVVDTQCGPRSVYTYVGRYRAFAHSTTQTKGSPQYILTWFLIFTSDITIRQLWWFTYGIVLNMATINVSYVNIPPSLSKCWDYGPLRIPQI